MPARDPAFAERMAENRTALAVVAARIDALETQLLRRSKRIDETTIDRFGELMSARLRGKDPSLRAAYLKMFVGRVAVNDSEIVISGPTAALEAGVFTGMPTRTTEVPSFDREWCPEEETYRLSNELNSKRDFHRLLAKIHTITQKWRRHP